ncbi:uncharacterized protein FIBRA_03470 [Fibroporia radiculosa]|uniref:Uncharacterized protein n=1 Tax=Fibroporia radiculosa TaxID=599839 RepID=J4H2F2_9APHY|nr:uncharacterized protein FIBRA_03470 [Fibroporia radiculosa]CCM01419.1 predicted protein [Fibroporia radiculosa]
MDFLRSKGHPIPKVHTYSFTSENEAGIPSMVMEYVSEGIELSQIWFHLEEDGIISLMDQPAKLEFTMMPIAFPAGGSIYYIRDLKELSGKEGIPLNEQIESASLEKERFCLGPDVSVPLWYGRREQLDAFRGPYEDAESVLTTGAKKELAYLDYFGPPRKPYRRFRREFYNYEKQSPSEHAKNLRHCLHLPPSLVPDDELVNIFRIRHPDLTDSHTWQHAAVLLLFLHAGMPSAIQNEEDEVSQRMIKPKLPGDFGKLSEEDQKQETEHLRRRLLHYHYILSTAAHNRIPHNGLIYPLNHFRRRIFNHATAVWEGETIDLLYALMDMVSGWAHSGKDGTPCPVVFTEDERDAAENPYQALANAEVDERMLRESAIGQELKRMTSKANAENEETTEEECVMIEASWPLDNVPEEELEECK